MAVFHGAASATPSHVPVCKANVPRLALTTFTSSVRAGIGISALSCFVAESYSDLIRVAPQKLASVADLWLLAHPDLVELPAVRAVIDFVAECARADRERLRG